MRTPPQVAPNARVSISGGSPHVGCPANDLSMSVMPTRETMATPFHCEVPWETDS
jgi:hypothetical protein